MKNSLGTNFVDIGPGVVPQGYEIDDYVPWIIIVQNTWEHFAARIETKDNDGWLRLHDVSLYAESLTNPTNRIVVVFSADRRSESKY